MDTQGLGRSLALLGIPVIAGALWWMRDKPRPSEAIETPPPAATSAEPTGLGPLAGALAERGEAALAEASRPKPAPVPSAPPPEAIAATNLPHASTSQTARTPERPRTARGSCGGVEVRLITASADPEWAFASLSPAAGERAVVRKIGERIGDYRLEKIEWDRVWLSGGGGRCVAAMHFGAREASEAALGGKKQKEPAPWRLPAEMIDGIEKLGETAFVVDRTLLPSIYAQAGALLAGIAIEPYRKEDQVVGFELGEVRADSLLERLGVESGDRVLAIDHAPAKDLAALIRALTGAREKEHLVARLERNGEAFDLEVSVR